MHHLVPPFILEKQANGETSGQFEAFVLFADVSGFSTISTALAEHGQHGAEVLSGLMRAVFDPLQKAIASHGGFITTSAGDAVMSVFPDDVGDGNERALAAAWAIRAHLLANAEQQTPYGTFPVGVKLGLSRGDVYWGIVASSDTERATYYFYGDAIDSAANAEKYAGQNDVVIAPNLVDLLSSAVDGILKDGYLCVVAVAEAALEDTVRARVPIPVEGDGRAGQDVFFPQEVLALPGVGEFRDSVNVFINLQGTPDEAQLTEFMIIVFVLQDKYGGVLNSVEFGDKGCKLLLFWGAPVSYENDVSRALGFLLALQSESAVSIRAGVTLRTGFAGFVGGAWHEEYTCYGHGVSLAARLMAGAPWDSIWVDEPIGVAAAHRFEVEYEEHFALKGFSEPQAAYVLLDRRQLDVSSFYASQMVGRRQELARLSKFVELLFADDTDTPKPGMFLIVGEAGIGKSRLLHNFQLELEQSGNGNAPQFFQCQTDQIVRSTLNPFRWWLRRYFGQSRQQSEARNKRAFSRRFRRTVAVASTELTERLEHGRSFLGALVDLHWENSAHAQYDPLARYENTMRALIALLMAEGERRPVIVLLEDAHWLDKDSIEFLRRLRRDASQAQLAVLATSREANSLQTVDEKVQVLELSGLVIDDLAHLIRNLLDGEASPQLVDFLMEKSGGNAFIAEQLILFLREDDALERGQDGWKLRVGAAGKGGIPANIRQIFTARLDRLSSEVRSVVQTAAVLGRE